MVSCPPLAVHLPDRNGVLVDLSDDENVNRLREYEQQGVVGCAGVKRREFGISMRYLPVCYVLWHLFDDFDLQSAGSHCCPSTRSP